MTTPLSRRSAIRTLAGSAALLGTAALAPSVRAADSDAPKATLKGNIKHSVSQWCYGGISLENLCQACLRMGIASIELLGPKQAETVKQAGLTCALLNCEGVSIDNGWNRTENHDRIIAGLKKTIDFAAAGGFPNVITFSGNRKGMSNDEGAKNCIAGLKQVAGYAEEKKVNIILELLNSKVDHKDYMCDHTAWGVEVCKGVGSERVKLLYDIYHMQIMEGDVIRTIKQFGPYIGHVHTGGVPGRNEIDETQELYYPAIMKALVEVRYQGYVGQEFIPKRDPLTSLQKAIQICDV